MNWRSAGTACPTASVSVYTDASGDGYTTTHELGHNLAATHCGAEQESGTWTVMISASGGCGESWSDRKNEFSGGNKGNISDCMDNLCFEDDY